MLDIMMGAYNNDKYVYEPIFITEVKRKILKKKLRKIKNCYHKNCTKS